MVVLWQCRRLGGNRFQSPSTLCLLQCTYTERMSRQLLCPEGVGEGREEEREEKGGGRGGRGGGGGKERGQEGVRRKEGREKGRERGGGVEREEREKRNE